MKQKILYWQDAATIDLLKTSLEADHVSITTTDTILGFLARLSEKSYQTLGKIKGSRDNKRYVILIASAEKLSHFIDSSSVDQQVLDAVSQCWPAPLTVVFKAHKKLPAYAVEADGTIALRCPRHEGLLKILAHFDGLFSTSANKSGQHTAARIEDVDPDLIAAVDYLITDREAAGKPYAPSTIVDLSQKTFKIIRPGAFDCACLQKYFENR